MFFVATAWSVSLVVLPQAVATKQSTLWDFRAKSYKHRLSVFLFQQCVISDAILGAPHVLLLNLWSPLKKHAPPSIGGCMLLVPMFYWVPHVLIAAKMLQFFPLHPCLVVLVLVHLCAGQFEHGWYRWHTLMVHFQEQRSIGKSLLRSGCNAFWKDLMLTSAISGYGGCMLVVPRVIFFFVPWPLIDAEMYFQLFLVPVGLIVKYSTVGPLALLGVELPRSEYHPLRGGAVHDRSTTLFAALLQMLGRFIESPSVFRNVVGRFIAIGAEVVPGGPALLLRTPSRNPSSWPKDIVTIPEELTCGGAFEDDVPSAMKCPITFSIMKNPTLVVTSGMTYENESIRTHKLNRPTAGDPLTRAPFRVPHDLVANYAMRDSIEDFTKQWKLAHPNRVGSAVV